MEGGRRGDRPQFGLALAECRARRAALLIAKLVRLARDAHFLLGLEKAGVESVAADMPHANPDIGSRLWHESRQHTSAPSPPPHHP